LEQWKGCSESIVKTTNSKNSDEIKLKDINLYLASLLVMGINSQPSVADYFQFDEKGIFGCHWMQNHFTNKQWSKFHENIHLEPKELLFNLNKNIKACWYPYQKLVVDEMMVPFTGKWKYRQCVKGKPHNTGLKLYGLADQHYYLWDFWLYEGLESHK